MSAPRGTTLFPSAVVLLLCAGLACAQAPAQDNDQADAAKPGSIRTIRGAPAVLTMLVLPMTTVTSGPQSGQNRSSSTATSEAATQDGCWARLYEGDNFEGDSFTLVGPVDLSNMQGPFGVDWSDTSSIEAGPKAAVTVYDNINFRDRAAQIKAGQRVPELGDRLGLFENVNSIRISCPQARTE